MKSKSGITDLSNYIFNLYQTDVEENISMEKKKSTNIEESLANQVNLNHS